MIKKINIFKDPFNFFAVMNLIIMIALFITLMVLVMPLTVENFDYLFNINVSETTTIIGWDILSHSSAIIYFLMFLGQCIYAIYGIYVLFFKNNERRVFKIMFRSIFYVSGMMMFYNIFAFIYFLFMPVTDITNIFVMVFLITSILVAIAGRIVSNFTFVTMRLSSRKKMGFFVFIVFIVLCAVSFFVLADDQHDTTTIIFYSLLIVSSLFGLPACLFFKDPFVYSFVKEPDINTKKVEYDEVDIPPYLVEINEHHFAKNLKLDKATINNKVKVIKVGAFANCLCLREVHLPHSLVEIQENAFFNCANLKKITYDGTRLEFNKIILKDYCFLDCRTNVIECIDGAVFVENKIYH